MLEHDLLRLNTKVYNLFILLFFSICIQISEIDIPGTYDDAKNKFFLASHFVSTHTYISEKYFRKQWCYLVFSCQRK